MSILIKGMNMPKDDCEAYREIIIVNVYMGDGKIEMQARDSNTNEFIGEVVEVPEPHGRLVDADFMKELGAKCIAKRCDDGVLLALGRIDDLPTVIEAEGQEHE